MVAGRPLGLIAVGLGARDTLRLEARMPLYGNELADDISPLEAGLGWAVKLDKGQFIGREAIAAMKVGAPPRRTVGFRLSSVPARRATAILCSVTASQSAWSPAAPIPRRSASRSGWRSSRRQPPASVSHSRS